ncbi:MAG TPA: hypothetical protein VLM89_13210 [Phycisphaerae bacterium]|nr:hypothetical protein [Phycisphaerae bacterium]
MNRRFRAGAWMAGGTPLLVAFGLGGCGAFGEKPVTVRESTWSPAAGIEGIRLETDHYDLKITATDPVLRQALPNFLETTFAEYNRLLPPAIGHPRKLEVYLFATREQWAAFTKLFVPQRAQVYLHIKAGGYVEPQTATAVVWDLGRDSTLTLLAHEGFHQYMAKFFPEPIVAWLNEGLATQWESFDLRSDGRPRFTPRLNYFRRNNLREGLSSPQAWIPLRTLLAMNAGQAVVQTGQVTRGYYAQVWSLVLFLREGGVRDYTRSFTRLLADLGTQHMHHNIRAYRAAKPEAGDASYGELILRRYITEDLDTFERQYRDFCEKLVR